MRTVKSRHVYTPLSPFLFIAAFLKRVENVCELLNPVNFSETGMKFRKLPDRGGARSLRSLSFRSIESPHASVWATQTGFKKCSFGPPPVSKYRTGKDFYGLMQGCLFLDFK
jgi:hypothetical protein